MARLSAIRDGLKANLQTIAGLRAHETIPDQVNTPAAVVGVPKVDYDVTMARGADKVTIPVRVYASRASERSGQDKLDEYLDSTGANSIKTAIESDPTLGAANAHVTRVVSAGEYGVYTIAGVEYLGVEFIVEVIA